MLVQDIRAALSYATGGKPGEMFCQFCGVSIVECPDSFIDGLLRQWGEGGQRVGGRAGEVIARQVRAVLKYTEEADPRDDFQTRLIVGLLGYWTKDGYEAER